MYLVLDCVINIKCSSLFLICALTTDLSKIHKINSDNYADPLVESMMAIDYS